MPSRSSAAARRSARAARHACGRRASRPPAPSARRTRGTWVLMPMPSRAIACGSSPATPCRGTGPAPAVGRYWPVRHLKKVLLPAPFGPIRQRSSPSCRVKRHGRRRRRRRSASSGPGLEERVASWIGLHRLASAVGAAAARGRAARPASTARRRPQGCRPRGTSRTAITSRTPSTRLGSTQPKPLTGSACRASWSASAGGCSRSPARSACRGRRRSPR